MEHEQTFSETFSVVSPLSLLTLGVSKADSACQRGHPLNTVAPK